MLYRGTDRVKNRVHALHIPGSLTGCGVQTGICIQPWTTRVVALHQKERTLSNLITSAIIAKETLLNFRNNLVIAGNCDWKYNEKFGQSENPIGNT